MDYVNHRNGDGCLIFRLRRLANNIRTWYKFHAKYPWVKYDGFVRVMRGVSFGKGMDIQIGNNVQFGIYSDIASNVQFGNNILCASGVKFIGRYDHEYNNPQKTIWEGDRGDNGTTIVEDDVWIGTNAIILSGVRIGKGTIIAAGSVVTTDIPSCEIWGGNPAKKLKDRFESDDKKELYLRLH